VTQAIRRGAHRPGAGAVTIRVVIADDHRVVRDGLCYLLGQEPGIEVAGDLRPSPPSR
jgi:hypothetical protein